MSTPENPMCVCERVPCRCVHVTRPDGTVTVEAPYTPDEAEYVILGGRGRRCSARTVKDGSRCSLVASRGDLCHLHGEDAA